MSLPVLEPIKSQKIYTLVVDRILDSIKSGKFKAGDRLPTERELAEVLAVSRGSVRQGLAVLEALSIIRTRPGAGTFVVRSTIGDPDIQSVHRLETEIGPFEILEARVVIEPAVAGRAASHRSSEHVNRMETCLSEMKEALEAGQSSWSPDWGFHVAIAEATQNAVIKHSIDVLTQYLDSPVWLAMRQRNFAVPDRGYKYLSEHRVIYDAIVAQRSDLAESAMRAHILSIMADLEDDTTNGKSDERV